MECELKTQCSGCTEWGTQYEVQLKTKFDNFEYECKRHEITTSDSKIEIQSVAKMGLRDRMDFTIENGKIGLYSHILKSILDIKNCLQLSPNLQDFYTDFRKINWPIKKGSFRLRVGPSGERGAWLDFANQDIKELLEENVQLGSLLKICSFVEIGQRRKKLSWSDKETRFRLLDPELQNWTNSVYRQIKIPLYSPVGGFSQVGHRTNEIIQKLIFNLCSQISYTSFLEYGCGNGNLTFPALSNGSSAVVIESDVLALTGLKKSLDENHISEKVRIFHDLNKINIGNHSLIIANPPRSGLEKFLGLIEKNNSQIPKYFIYMSCFPESYFNDVQRLMSLGYKLGQVHIVDQFPQTKHYEIISLLKTTV
jgi:23S rRNA (uracil1939-C5)-methyltransferase